MIVCIVNSWRWIACEQALWCALAAGQEKEGELATIYLEFEYLHRKSWCEMLIRGDDIYKLISNDMIMLGTCFSMFVFISFLLLRADWRKSDSSVNAEPQGNWRWNSNSREVVASSPSFSRPTTCVPRELACRLHFNCSSITSIDWLCCKLGTCASRETFLKSRFWIQVSLQPQLIYCEK